MATETVNKTKQSSTPYAYLEILLRDVIVANNWVQQQRMGGAYI